MSGPILRAEHDQRAVEQLVHVDDLVRRPVHLRVLLGRADQGGDPGGRVLDLVHQQLGLDRVVQPAQRAVQVAAAPARSARRRDLVQPGGVEAAPATKIGASSQPPATPWSSSQSRERVLAVGGLHRAQLSAPWRPARRPPPAARPALQGRRGRARRPAIMAELVPHPGDPLAQRGGGPDRGRGRVVQLVGQPGRQRAEGQQPLPLADRLLGVLDAEEQALRAGARPSGTSRA